MQSMVQWKTLQSITQLPKFSMKALRDFQRQQFVTPNAPFSVHYHRTLHCLGYNNSSIDQLTQLEQEHLHVEINREDYSELEVEIQNEVTEFEVNMPLIVFKEGHLSTFRGSDAYYFNVIEPTGDVDFKKMTSRSKMKGNILILHSEDDGVAFQREEQWKADNLPT